MNRRTMAIGHPPHVAVAHHNVAAHEKPPHAHDEGNGKNTGENNGAAFHEKNVVANK